MNLLKLSLCAAVASVGLGGAAFAQSAPSVTANLAVTSNYVFRGFSQVGAYDPAVQGGVDASMGIAYAGAWASNVKYGNGTDAEVDLYGGIKPSYGGFNFDLGAIYYLYPGQPSKASLAYADENYIEFKGAVSHAAGPLTLGAAVYYSPDFTFTPGVDADGVYYEGNASFSPVENVTVSGAVGHQYIDLPGASYTTWNLGSTWQFAKNFSIDARYWDTDVTGLKAAGPRGVVTLKATYP